MRKLILLGGVLGVVVVTSLLANCRTAQAPSPPPATRVAPAPSSGTAPSASGASVAGPSSTTTVSPPAPASPYLPPPATGEALLAERRKLTRPGTTPALEAMKQFERDEMLLVAQVQKRTRRAPTPPVKEILDARRNGASFDELWALTDQKLAGDAEMMLAVRGWLNEVVRPRDGAPGARAEDPSKTPLELGGAIAPK